MKIIKFGIITAVFAFTLGASFATSPGPVYTYEFTAKSGQPITYNESTITLQGTDSTTNIALVDWNLLGWSGGPVTKSNSSAGFQSFSFYGTTTFYGNFDISGFSTDGEFFDGGNSPTGGNLDLLSDPPGVWRRVPAGVPDSGTTLSLFVLALGGLVVVRRRIGSRA